jgi:hypothetical protein
MALTEHALLTPDYLDRVGAMVAADPAVAGGPADDDLTSIDELCVCSQAKIGDTWCWVWQVDTVNRRILVQEDGLAQPAYWYPVTAGERFVVAEPF